MKGANEMICGFDPVRDIERDYEGKERKLAQRPRCAECGERIQDEYAYEIDNELICEECLDRYYKKNVDDMMAN